MMAVQSRQLDRLISFRFPMTQARIQTAGHELPSAGTEPRSDDLRFGSHDVPLVRLEAGLQRLDAGLLYR